MMTPNPDIFVLLGRLQLLQKEITDIHRNLIEILINNSNFELEPLIQEIQLIEIEVNDFIVKVNLVSNLLDPHQIMAYEYVLVNSEVLLNNIQGTLK
jgi:hypothetical protein